RGAARPAQQGRERGRERHGQQQHEPAHHRGPRPQRGRGRLGEVRVRRVEVAVEHLVVVELARRAVTRTARGVRGPGALARLRARRGPVPVGVEVLRRLRLRRRGLARCLAGTEGEPLLAQHPRELGVDVARVGGAVGGGAHAPGPGQGTAPGTCASRNLAEVSNSRGASWSRVARWWLRVRERRWTRPRTRAATRSLSVGGTVWSVREVASSSGAWTRPSPRRVRRKSLRSWPTARTGIRS